MTKELDTESIEGLGAFEGWVRSVLTLAVSVALTLFVLIEVNFTLLTPLQQSAIFVSAGLVLCFLQVPLHERFRNVAWLRWIDYGLAIVAVLCCVYMVRQGSDLGQRAALYTTPDLWVGTVGLVLILEAARRTVGWSLPILAVIFMLYAHESIAQDLPAQLFPHRGHDWESIIGQTYLRTDGVFGTAASVMFRYVFLFVLFGALLQLSGATNYVIGLAVRMFGTRAGGPAKVAVLASGLMGSLSGSAVANAATTGNITIPLMKRIGFKPHDAAGIEAAASSGGALVPPVMGAGAYMMMDIIDRTPSVSFIEIMQAALLPAMLYYFSLFLLVHFSARRLDSPRRPTNLEALEDGQDTNSLTYLANNTPLISFAGLAFFGSLGILITLLLSGFSPFRAVTYSMVVTIVILLINPATPVSKLDRVLAGISWLGLLIGLSYGGHLADWLEANWLEANLPENNDFWSIVLAKLVLLLRTASSNIRDALIFSMAGLFVLGFLSKSWFPLLRDCFRSTAAGGIPLIVAAACVGVMVGMVGRTGIGSTVPQQIIRLAGEHGLFVSLLAIMGCSLVLGMGLPSVVSYLLLATTIGSIFVDPALGVPLLAAHLFIFYFGMMAMVTPPVALAAFATASIARANVFWSSVSAFRYSLVGFTLPFMFIYRPALCLMSDDGGPPVWIDVVFAVVAAVLGIIALAAALAGFLFHRLGYGARIVLFLAAACSLFPDQFGILGNQVQLFDLIGLGLLSGVTIWDWRRDVPPPRENQQPPAIDS